MIQKLINRISNKKPVKVDMYTDRADVYNKSRIVPAKSAIPSWYKDVSPNPVLLDDLAVQLNMRHCAGFNSLYSNGFIIPMWSDVNIENSKIGETWCRWQFADRRTSAEAHGQQQRGEFLHEKEFQNLKMSTPWICKCDEDVDFLLMPVLWDEFKPSEYFVLSGIVNFKYQNSANINMMLPKKEMTSIVQIPADRPMIHMIPITERDVVYELHLVSPEEMEYIHQSTNPKRSFFANYKKNKNRKCPFSSNK